MKKTLIYDYLDYRNFLAEQFPSKGVGRGGRSALAQFLNCELSFVSLVLNKKTHFSFEHAFSVAEFLKLTPQETEFFLLLVSKNRAGSKKLEAYYESKLAALLEKRTAIRDRIQTDQTLGLEQQLEYYSHWAYTAVHMCLLNRKLNHAEEIAKYLGVPVVQIKKILEFFLSTGLAKQEGGGIHSGPVRMHIPNDSPLVSRHHANWRLRSLETLSGPKPGDLRYSLIMSVSKKDAERIRALFLDAIQNAEPIFMNSEDETVQSLSLDFFEVGDRGL